MLDVLGKKRVINIQSHIFYDCHGHNLMAGNLKFYLLHSKFTVRYLSIHDKEYKHSS